MNTFFLVFKTEEKEDTIRRAVVELTTSEKVEGCSFVRTQKRQSVRRNILLKQTLSKAKVLAKS